MAELSTRRVVVIADPAAPLGLLANAVGVVALGLGAVEPALAGQQLQDCLGRQFRASASLPLPVLQAGPEAMHALFERARSDAAIDAVVAFPHFARQIHDFASYQISLRERDLASEALAAIGLLGEGAAVKGLTRGLALLR